MVEQVEKTQTSVLKENVIVSYYYIWYFFFKNILFSLNEERKLKLVSTIKIIKQRN